MPVIPAAGPLLAPLVLDRQRTIATRDPDEAHSRISELFCAHSLSVLQRDRQVNMTLRSKHDASVGLDLLDYGATVRISPRALQDFVLVQIPLRGRAEIEVAGTTYYSDPDTASLPPIDQDCSMVWYRGTPQLVVYVRREEVERVAIALYGSEHAHGLDLGYTLKLTSPAGVAFLDFVRNYLNDVNTESEAARNDFSQRLLHEMLIMRLLLAAENPILGAPIVSQTSNSRLVRRFRTVIADHGTEEISVLDIAETLGVSLRSLQHSVRDVLGTTPSALLRQARLAEARSLLLAGEDPAATVTDIAIRAGFTHLGRFASSYRAAFGESPSATLRR
ncbi:MAG: AraC family transcriptional regulator [Microbacteriaceae bacterium]